MRLPLSRMTCSINVECMSILHDTKCMFCNPRPASNVVLSRSHPSLATLHTAGKSECNVPPLARQRKCQVLRLACARPELVHTLDPSRESSSITLLLILKGRLLDLGSRSSCNYTTLLIMLEAEALEVDRFTLNCGRSCS